MSKTGRGLIVPALTGKFGQWRYYQLILSVSELVCNFGTEEKPDYRVKAVEEVEEIYSQKGVSNLLQRAFDVKRLLPLRNYILNQQDRYINNLTIGIFGGDPDWHGLNIDPRLKDQDARTKDSVELDVKDIEERVGIIQLDGSETLFVLDGQHRLKGLRKAYEESPDSIGRDQVVCTVIVHRPDEQGRIRTRRLFSTVNRHAKPVSNGENILLDEDDVSAIVVRALIEEFDVFKDREAVALSKGGNISLGDQDRFTTVVTLYDINEKLIDHARIYHKVDGKIVRIRPESEELITQQKELVFKYWKTFVELWPTVEAFLKDSTANRRKYRIGGGSFILRPIAQVALFEVLRSCGLDDKSTLEKLKALPELLTDPFWHYVLWDPHKGVMLSNRAHVRNYIRYHVGLKLTAAELKRLQLTYQKNSGDLKLKLPAVQA